jgi:hypothetical protein
MTGSCDHPAGLLTDAEAERLADVEHSLADDPELRAKIQTRLEATLEDCGVLYPTLPEEDIAAVFDVEDSKATGSIRGNTQDALGLLVIGMLTSDDMIETRLQDAIRSAGISYGEEIDVTVELRRGPLPSVEEFVARVHGEGISMDTFDLFEHFLSQPDTDVSVLEDVAEEFDIEFTAAEKEELEAGIDTFERLPQVAVTDISIPIDDDDSQ